MLVYTGQLLRSLARKALCGARTIHTDRYLLIIEIDTKSSNKLRKVSNLCLNRQRTSMSLSSDPLTFIAIFRERYSTWIS